MIETFIALSFSHVLADYVFQASWMVERKREPGVMVFHIALVLALSMAAVGRVDAPEILMLAGAHLVIDCLKTYLSEDGLVAYLSDQFAHFISILAITVYVPTLWQSGIYAEMSPSIPHVMLLISGLIFATRAGAFAIGRLMDAQPSPEGQETGLPEGGLTIGVLERGLIFALMIGGLASSIGFLIAAKSILRFGAVNEDRSASEYVIIGTLASFGWAILVSLVVLKLQTLLPALEITAQRP